MEVIKTLNMCNMLNSNPAYSNEKVLKPTMDFTASYQDLANSAIFNQRWPMGYRCCTISKFEFSQFHW